MDVVMLALSHEVDEKDITWEVELVTQTKLIGSIEGPFGGVYVINNGQNRYFTADKVSYIGRY